MKKAYEIPEIELHTIPALHTIEIGASWPWGDTAWYRKLPYLRLRNHPGC